MKVRGWIPFAYKNFCYVIFCFIFLCVLFFSLKKTESSNKKLQGKCIVVLYFMHCAYQFDILNSNNHKVFRKCLSWQYKSSG